MPTDAQAALTTAVIDGDLDAARLHTQALVDAAADPERILKDALIPAMAEVGQRFERGDYFVPEMLLSARAMHGALAILEPLLAAAAVKPIGTIVAGTVKGDVHDIGKNLVCMMLRGSGFAVHDLGVDVPPERFVEAVRDHRADLVALSALLTTTMPAMRTTIDALRAAGLRDRIRVIVGGAPLTAEFAAAIGADGYAEDASRGATLARSLIE